MKEQTKPLRRKDRGKTTSDRMDKLAEEQKKAPTASQIADELEEYANKLLAIAKDLRGKS